MPGYIITYFDASNGVRTVVGEWIEKFDETTGCYTEHKVPVVYRDRKAARRIAQVKCNGRVIDAEQFIAGHSEI